ncbi:nucleotidyltransferase family protein [Kiloniella antarctica]|uniref:NTP transferase domain-containing protein n=1 Tax=Kiloniella antarctica TaxID=1550907 RepID=A0ABW5BKF9_9PROT
MTMPSPIPNIEIILLAAGLSKRMGERNKLLMPFRGQPLVRFVASQLIKSNIGPVTVITGHDANLVKQTLDGLNLNFIFNQHYSSGQMSSVQCGVQKIKPSTQGIMIALADMPDLTSGDYQRILEGFTHNNCEKIVVPYFSGKRGNPILIPKRLTDEIINGSLQAGCRRLIENRPQDVHRLDVTCASHTTDIDTPNDYSYWLKQFIVLPACC